MEKGTPSQITDQIDGWLKHHRAEISSFLSSYVQHKSVNLSLVEDAQDSELESCQEWLAGELRDWRVFDEVRLPALSQGRPNVCAVRHGSATGPGILFNGHSDVVPVTAAQRNDWTWGSPWGGDIVDDYVTGRGAVDMKGGNTAFLWALRAVAEVAGETSGPQVATVVAGEESGEHGIGIDVALEAVPTAKLVIVAEPTDLDICPASVGEFYFRVEISGRSTSLANRHLNVHPQPIEEPVSGVNAIDKMWKVQGALLELEREWGIWQRHPLMQPGNMNINVSQIGGGTTFSALADHCWLVGSVLFNPSLSVDQVRAEFTSAIDSVAASDYWLRDHPPRLTLPHILDAKPPVNSSPSAPASLAAVSAWRSVREAEPVLRCTSFTSDANYIVVDNDVVVLTWGPGRSSYGVHAASERIAIDDVIDAARMYARTILDWCRPV